MLSKMVRSLSLAALLVLMVSAPGRAADRPATASPTPLADAVERAAVSTGAAMPEWAADRPDKRPATLPVLYGGYAALQVLDVVSSRHALAAGATEVNPLLKQGGGARTIAIKAAAGAGTIFFAERAWKKNKVGAIVMMAALNGATAAIVARNAHHASLR
jgi:hypothetical protein